MEVPDFCEDKFKTKKDNIRRIAGMLTEARLVNHRNAIVADLSPQDKAAVLLEETTIKEARRIREESRKKNANDQNSASTNNEETMEVDQDPSQIIPALTEDQSKCL